ncbi:TPA: hypothetical protein ACKE3D_004852, partial [Burkholderia dolosa]
ERRPRRMRRRPRLPADAKMLLSSISPRIDHAAVKVGSGGRRSGMAATPARLVAGAGRDAPGLSLCRSTAAVGVP